VKHQAAARPTTLFTRPIRAGDELVIRGRRMHIQEVTRHPDGLVAVRWQPIHDQERQAA